MELVRQGKAELLMKGSLHTDELLGAVVARETGLRTGRRISHVFIMDVPTYHKVLIVTDAAINIAPTLEDKVDICQNAIDLAISLGVEQPKVAILAAVETVNSKMPATLDAAALCKMAERGQITGGAPRRPAGVRQRHQQGGGEDQGDSLGGRRRSRHPARAGPRGGQHAGQAAQLPGQRRQRRPRARRARADHPDQPRRQRALADRELRASRCWRRMRGGRRSSEGGCVMDDYALVLNAGSSSLKFCVYQRPDGEDWRLEARGQIEGIGTSPRLSAKDGAGGSLADREAGRGGARRPRRARCAGRLAPLHATAARACSASATASSTAARDSPARVVTPQVLEELRALVPLAPLHQPYNLAAIEAVAERLPGVPQVACFDTSFHRGQPAVAELVPLPREICARRRAALRLPRPVVRVHRLGAAARWRRRSPTGA